MKLKTKILVFSVTLTLVISASMGISSIFFGIRSMNSSIYNSITEQAKINAENISQNIEFRLAVLTELANRARTRSLDFDIQKKSLIEDIDRLGYLDFGIVDKTGHARYIKGNTTAELADRSYIKAALTGKANVSDILISRVTNSTVVMFAIPITVDGTVQQVLIARADGNVFSEVTNKMKFGTLGYAYMLNDKGTVVSHRNNDLVLNQFNPINESGEKPELKTLASAFQTMIQMREGTNRYFYNGNDIINGYYPVRNTNWIFSLTAIRTEFLKPIQLMTTAMLAGTLILLAIGVFFSFLMAAAIAKPIIQASRRLKEISSGNADLTQELAVLTKDEMGTLATDFNRFIRSLGQIIATIKSSVIQLKEIGTELGSNMTETSSSIIQITANIDSVNHQIHNQAAGVQETLATVKQITKNIDMFNHKISMQTENINLASTAIEEMVSSIHSVSNSLEHNAQNIKTLLTNSENGRKKLDDVSRIIREIAQASEGMMQANTVISKISAQTNLLAMNAAIEAAHAGDSGRGFAVVADEIRKLAENSSIQTKSITSVLKEIKTSIDSAVSHSREAQTGFDTVLKGIIQVNDQETEIQSAMKEQSIGGTEVLRAITGINQTTTEIKNGSSEILEGGNAILAEMNQLMQVTEQIQSSIQEMSLGAKEISDATIRINDLSQNNAKSIETVESQILEFKVRQNKE